MNRPIIIITLFYIAAILIFSFITGQHKNPVIKLNNPQEISVVGVVESEPVAADNNVSFQLSSRYLTAGSRKIRARRKYSVMIFSGEEQEAVRYGDLLEVSGKYDSGQIATNPGSFSYGEYLERKGISGTITVFTGKKGRSRLIARGKGNAFIAGCIGLKDRIVRTFRRSMPEPYCALMGSIIFGSKASPIPSGLKEKFQKSGVVHVLVASGQQVSILIGVCLAVSRYSTLSPAATYGIVSLFIWGFAAMAGFGASILRSAIMGQVMIAGMYFERDGEFYNTFALSALVLLVMDPGLLYDIGFQLTYLATWSLVYLSPILKDLLKNKLPEAAAASISVAFAPVIVTTPLSVYYFSQLTFVAFLSNIIVVPFAEVLTTIGFTSSAIGLVFEPLAILVNRFSFVLLLVLTRSVEIFSTLPMAFTYIEQPNAVFVILYFALIVWAAEQLKNKTLSGKIKKYRPAILVLVAAFLVFQCLSSFRQKDLVITVIDVGQGDSILIEMPNGKKVLIDGGGKAPSTTLGVKTGKRPKAEGEKKDSVGEKIVVPFLHRKGINRLDLVVLTHPHDDHAGGLAPVLEEIGVGAVLDSGQPHASPSYLNFLRLIQEKHIRYRVAERGMLLSFGDVKGRVLAPAKARITGTGSDLNNNSIVIRLVYGKNSFLFMGDAAFEEEQDILSSCRGLRSNVLKIGHHGSATSTGADLLDAVRPEASLISAGRQNKFGHPSEGTLARIEERGIEVFRTDISGALTVKSDGRRIRTGTYLR